MGCYGRAGGVLGRLRGRLEAGGMFCQLEGGREGG